MEPIHVDGVNKGNLLLYTLSTCIWCKKTKTFLSNQGIGYDFVEVDMLPDEEKKKAITEIQRVNPQCSFPTLVVDGTQCVVGYDEARIKGVLGL